MFRTPTAAPLGLAAALLFTALLLPASAQAEPPAPAATPAAPAAAPPAAPTASTLPEPPIPTQHAVQAGIGRCASAIDQLSRLLLRFPYNAQSTWNQATPADHLFQSVIGLKNPTAVPAGAMVAIVAAPVPNETCDAVAMEVRPLPVRCADVQKSFQGDTAMLEDLAVLTDPQKRRLMLLPGAADTCIAITVHSFYGNKP